MWCLEGIIQENRQFHQEAQNCLSSLDGSHALKEAGELALYLSVLGCFGSFLAAKTTCAVNRLVDCGLEGHSGDSAAFVARHLGARG